MLDKAQPEASSVRRTTRCGSCAPWATAGATSVVVSKDTRPLNGLSATKPPGCDLQLVRGYEPTRRAATSPLPGSTFEGAQCGTRSLEATARRGAVVLESAGGGAGESCAPRR